MFYCLQALSCSLCDGTEKKMGRDKIVNACLFHGEMDKDKLI